MILYTATIIAGNQHINFIADDADSCRESMVRWLSTHRNTKLFSTTEVEELDVDMVVWDRHISAEPPYFADTGDQ